MRLERKGSNVDEMGVAAITLPVLCPNFARTTQSAPNPAKSSQTKKRSATSSRQTLKPCFQRVGVILLLVGHMSLDLAILVRVQASQPKLFPY